MEVNLADFIYNILVVECYKSKSSVSIGHLVKREHSFFDLSVQNRIDFLEFLIAYVILKIS